MTERRKERQGALTRLRAEPPAGVRIKQLEDYLEREVLGLALKDGKKQRAVVERNDFDEESRIGNAIPIRQGNLTIRFSPGRIGPIILVTPNDVELECPNVGQDWVLNTEKGPHILYDRGVDPVKEHPFRFSPKSETYVDF